MRFHNYISYRKSGGMQLGCAGDWKYNRVTDEVYCELCYACYAATWWDRLLVKLGLMEEA